MEISYIVPCFNESKNIREVYNQIILANEYSNISDYEIILINDFSNDNTLEIFEDIQKQNKKIIIKNNYKNLGLGRSIKEGLNIANKEYVMYLPGDNCHSSSEISKMLLEENNYDILLSYYSNKKDRSFFRWIFTAIYTPFLNLIFNKKLPYYNGIAIYKKNIVDNVNLVTSGFTWQIELLVKILKDKKILLKLKPTILNERNHGKSKAFRLKNCFIVIYSILNIWIWNLFN
tara:strand:- start:10885 stop:11580 length:696 start_codon:yes stop_codon:yes gene_type:complete